MPRWIVVGGGAAGSVIAGRLSAEPSNEVILLEAGADHGVEPATGDRGPFFGDPDRITSYPVRRRAGGRVEPESYVLGFGLGGSSLINGSIVVASGPGGDGRHSIPLELPTRLGPLGGALLDADKRAERLLLTARHGQRITAADAYVRPFVDRSNLTITTGATVERVIIDGRRATGVRTIDGATIDGDRVVMAAGAIGTPLVLLRSGIDTPGIGQHLQDHPAFSIALLLDGRTDDDNDAHGITVAVSTATHQIIALERTEPDSSLGALVVGLTATTSRGSLWLDGAGQPTISLNQLDTVGDRESMTTAVLDTIDIVDRSPLGAVVAETYADDRGTPLTALGRDRAVIGRWLDDHLTGFHHVAGTCRRGEVVDEDGWVRGYHNLAIADASLFVNLPPTNVYLSTVLQAEELAGRWLWAGR